MSEYLVACVSWLKDMERLSDSERGRLFTALLKYASCGEKEEPRGTEKVFFQKMCDEHDAQYIYINNNISSSQVSTEGTRNLNTYLEDSFIRFWSTWPEKYKVNRKRCVELWKKIKPNDALVDKMIESVEAWKKSRQWQQGYVPNPDTWLRGEKWNDAKPDPWTEPRNAFANHSQRKPMSDEEIKKLCINLDDDIDEQQSVNMDEIRIS